MGSGSCPSIGLYVRRHRRLIVLPLVGGTRTGDLDVTEVERPAGEVVGQNTDTEGKYGVLLNCTANRTIAAALGGQCDLSARWNRACAILDQHFPGGLRRLCDPHHDWRRTG